LKDGIIKKTSMPSYESKVPLEVRTETAEKLSKYEVEMEANAKSI
jgi:hypothetical protein